MIASHLFRFLAASIGAVSAASCVSTKTPSKHCDLAIANVAVVDVISGAIKPAQTVRIGDGFILSIAPERSRLGGNCSMTVDASSQFLAPGLNDAHVHLETEAFVQAFGLAPTEMDYQAAMAIYLVHGVTGIRVLSGGPDILAFRDANRETATPLLQVSSPMLSGEPPVLPEPLTKVVTDAAAARAAVNAFLDQGYDFIKIRGNLDETTYYAVLEETRALGAYVDGHLTHSVGPYAVLASTQKGFAHIDEFAVALSTSDDLARMTNEFVNCDCFTTSALGVTGNIVAQLEDYERMIARDEIAYLNPLIVDTFWRKPNNPYFSEGAPALFFQGLHQQSVKLFVSLFRGSVPIVAGTDAMNPMIIPGASIHDELKIMTDAGLTPIEALRTATLTASELIPGFSEVGILEAGRRANAILVSQNPLEGLEVLRHPDAVVINGFFLDKKALDESVVR